jgi:hypothetical protein
LVLNLLRGLNPHYGHLKALIKWIVPFPTFHAVRNELLLEELSMTHEAPPPVSALYSATTGTQTSSGGQAPPPPPHFVHRGPQSCPVATPCHALTTDSCCHPRKGSCGGGSSSCGGTTDRGGGHTWPSFYNPWADTISMWPGHTPGASHPLASAPALLIMPPAYGAPLYTSLVFFLKFGCVLLKDYNFRYVLLISHL